MAMTRTAVRQTASKKDLRERGEIKERESLIKVWGNEVMRDA